MGRTTEGPVRATGSGRQVRREGGSGGRSTNHSGVPLTSPHEMKALVKQLGLAP